MSEHKQDGGRGARSLQDEGAVAAVGVDIRLVRGIEGPAITNHDVQDDRDR